MKLNHQGKASIVILTHNNLEFTRGCLESIFSKTKYPDFEIIVVDNASMDGTLEYLEEVKSTRKNLRVISNNQNLGFARANNQGAQAAEGNYLVFLNNDTLVTGGWLTRLINHLQDKSTGLAGPVTNSASNEAKVTVSYDSIDGLDRFAEKYTSIHEGETFQIRALAFFCVAMRSELFHEIGPLDERFGLGMFEDDDYALRVRNQGYQVVCAEDVFIHHWGGASFLDLDPYQYWLLFRENRRKFEEKWGVTWQPHIHRAELLPDQVIELSERNYLLQWQLLTETPGEMTDDSFSIVLKRLAEQEKKIEELSSTLNEIKSSNAWRLVQFAWKIRQFLTPGGARRADILTSMLNKPSAPGEIQPDPGSSNDQIPSSKINGIKLPGKVQVSAAGEQVFILAPQFFDFEGQSTFIGGAERYLLELLNILQQMGKQPFVYQSADWEWEREYQGVPFIGLNTSGDIGRLNVQFHHLYPDNPPVIYMVFNLAAPYHSDTSIGISHGIFWDVDTHESVAERTRAIDFLVTSFSNLAHIVSVDTNTINWLRTVQPPLADKCSYIPNFVDLNQFFPVELSEREEIIILYPRRLYARRGFWMVHELVPEFLERYPQVLFKFVGQADEDEKIAVQQMVQKYPGRVDWRTVEMPAMHTVYKQADISLFPSLHSEGTSLSCLEAMATGNAVIASNVGGLTDLVIPGYNGLLIEPNVASLRRALTTLCEDADLRTCLMKRGREVAENFDLDSWKLEWHQVINEIF